MLSDSLEKISNYIIPINRALYLQFMSQFKLDDLSALLQNEIFTNSTKQKNNQIRVELTTHKHEVFQYRVHSWRY